MNFLLLGLGVGLVSVCSPGPVSMSLLQVATTQGRRSGAQAAMGVASGDVILSILAVGMVTLGTTLPAAGFNALRVLSSVVLITLGTAMLARPHSVQARAAAVSRPYRSFLAVTTLLPSAFGSWLALLAAMPFAADRANLATFAAGIVVLSFVWHLLLSFGASMLGPRLTPTALAATTRVGGLATLGLGLWSLT